MSEFGFVENCNWLKTFIISLKKHYTKLSTIKRTNIEDNSSLEDTIFTDTTLTFQDATDFAVQNLNAVFKEDCLAIFYDKYTWTECIEKGNQYKHVRCRRSSGFGNKYVPNTKKFNPLFHDKEYSDILLLAKNSYRYLYYRSEIEIILKTPSSDYSRFSIECYTNVLNRFFMLNLRNIQKNGEGKLGPFDQILETYNSKVNIM